MWCAKGLVSTLLLLALVLLVDPLAASTAAAATAYRALRPGGKRVRSLVTGLEWTGKASAGHYPAKPRWHPSYFPPPLSDKEEGARADPRSPARIPAGGFEPSPETNAMGGPVPTMDTAISFAAAPVFGPNI